MKSELSGKDRSKESNLIAFIWDRMYFRLIWILALVAFIPITYLDKVADAINADWYAPSILLSIGIPILNVTFYFMLWVKNSIDGFLSHRKEVAHLENRRRAYAELERAKRLLENEVISKEEYEHILLTTKPKLTEKK